MSPTSPVPPVHLDPGFPPEQFEQQAALREKLLKGPLTETDLTAMEATPTEENTQVQKPIVPAQLAPRHRVMLRFFSNGKPFLKVQFNALDVNVGEDYITLFFEPTILIEPSDITDLVLTYREQQYPVSWVGSVFKLNLAGISASGISFLRKPNDDQNSSSPNRENAEPGQR